MKAKTFRSRLWRCFALLTLIILGMIWLLQTLFLQSSYRGMVERNVHSAAKDIEKHRADADFEAFLNGEAADNSLLIFITDAEGQVLYATDEHNGVYAVQTDSNSGTGSNPYRQTEQSWQRGQSRYLTLPDSYEALLSEAKASADKEAEQVSADGSALTYVAGIGDEFLCISAALTAVGATVRILRIQLIWVSVLSLLLAFGLAWLLAKRFSAPVLRIADKAQQLSGGQYDPAQTKGFSTELDTLSDALSQAAADISEARAYQRDFLANISHDLRTPLTMIRGYAEMVRDLSWRDEKKRVSDTGIIIREADRLTSLVNDIVDYSALESEKLESRAEPFCFSDAVREVIDQFTSLCGSEGYMILSDVADELHCRGDKAQLSRVLYNLIDNALTHAGEDKTVLIRVSRRSDSIHTEVEDHGGGIPAEVLEHVWDRYFRAAQRKRNKKGSGLGLAISREIVEKHGGGCGVQSTPGKGSVFSFDIPYLS